MADALTVAIGIWVAIVILYALFEMTCAVFFTRR